MTISLPQGLSAPLVSHNSLILATFTQLGALGQGDDAGRCATHSASTGLTEKPETQTQTQTGKLSNGAVYHV